MDVRNLKKMIANKNQGMAEDMMDLQCDGKILRERDILLSDTQLRHATTPEVLCLDRQVSKLM